MATPFNLILISLFGFLGGLSLFIIGINWMGIGLQKSAGNKMREVLKTLTANKYASFTTGILTALIVQSSGATAALLVNFVNAGLLEFGKTITILLGASVGATITAQLIAFRITEFSLVFVTAGTILYLFFRNKNINGIGEAIIGIGLLFLGLSIMSSAISPLENQEGFRTILVSIQSPYISFVIAALVTMLIQSSGAFIGIIIVLSMHQLLTLDAAIGMVIGTNLGTAITPLFVSINTTRDAKKTAFTLLFIKAIGVLLFIGWIPYFADLIRYISQENANATIATPRAIANAHSFFNISIAFLMLPFTSKFNKLIDRIVPVKNYTEDEHIFQLKYLDTALLRTPDIAIKPAKQETARMCKNIRLNITDLTVVFIDKKEETLTDVRNKRKKTEYLYKKTHDYLIKISKEQVSEKTMHEVFQLLFIINEFGKISNIYNNLIENEAKKWIELPIAFSDEGKHEIRAYHEFTTSHLKQAIDALLDEDAATAAKLREDFKAQLQVLKEYEICHFMRIRDENKNTELTARLHLEIMQTLTIINEHTSNIARMIMDWDIQKQSGVLKLS